jgi:peptidoglycan/LPS O-acetylase OafA/YrhL
MNLTQPAIAEVPQISHGKIIAADSHELRPLTGIRGLAAFLVIFFHFRGFTVLFPSLDIFNFVWSKGGLGVDLFFMLSGFILSYVYAAGEHRLTLKSYGKFLWFRLARLYPNHVVTLGILGCCLVIAGIFHKQVAGSYPLSSLPFQLTLTHSWPYLPGSQWNYPAWSISAEWFAYAAIFPGACIILFPGRVLHRFYLPLAYGFLVVWLILERMPALDPFATVLQVSLEFLAGSLLFGLYRTAGCRMTRFFQCYLDIILVLLILGLAVLPVSGQFTNTYLILFFPCMLLGLTSESSFTSRLFSTRLALWFGNISYALYMTHAVSQKILKILLPMERFTHSSSVVRFFVLFAYLATIIGMAAGLYYAVEVPSRNVLRRFYNTWVHKLQ